MSNISPSLLRLCSPVGCRRLWNWFTAVDTDRSGHISAPELRTSSLLTYKACFLISIDTDLNCSCSAEKALINGDWTPFDLDTVKLLMSIFVRSLSLSLPSSMFTQTHHRTPIAAGRLGSTSLPDCGSISRIGKTSLGTLTGIAQDLSTATSCTQPLHSSDTTFPPSCCIS